MYPNAILMSLLSNAVGVNVKVLQQTVILAKDMRTILLVIVATTNTERSNTMWIETIDGNMVNSQQATGIQTTEASGRYEVHIEVPVANQSRNPMRTVFRSEDKA